MGWSSFIFALGLASRALEAASPVTANNLDAIARSYTANNKFMGSVLVADGQNPLLNKSYGMASLEWNVPDGPETKFRLGSLTKQFTASLVLLLQQDGRLDIQDPIRKYLPEVPKSWAKITLSHLLHHTSGIPNFTDFEEFGAWSMIPRKPAEELAFIRDRPLDFVPGSKFSYSNSNYEVLGLVIERVGRKSFADQLRERILGPLGMRNTGLDRDDLLLSNRAQGYSLGKHGLSPARSESMSVPWAAGSMYSTTEDLLRWETGLFGGKILNSASLAAMTTPGLGDYALGVQVIQFAGARVVMHDGGIEGFSSYLSYVPKRKITVVVLSNVNGDAPDSMGRKLLTAALN